MTGTGIIHSNNLQICLGVFRSRRAPGANALRAGTLRRRPRSSGWGRAAPHRPAPAPSPPVICFSNSSLQSVGWGGGRVRYPGRGLRGRPVSPRGAGDPAGGGRDVLGELLLEMPGGGSEGGLSAGVVFGGTRGCRCRRSPGPAHARTQPKRVSEPPSLAATSSL